MERRLPLSADESVPPDRLADFYRSHADRVDALVAELRDATPPSEVAEAWPLALRELTAHAAWARTVADTVDAEGLDADQTPHAGLGDFRTLMPYGACHDLLDVN